ncbi:MAG TPA: extracellular solute-binding protein [Candidatus Latescibacteria bacterium]|nr:hypothetical protein [Gemmatimonadaceae bacterium]MDP6015631.1 extracellular solute-binding protein [Candidatus Latescibacterota bacterium]HJP29215.1 extracellular solute-binding protein [Candidatus Latescibacterota bacterium]
MRVCVTLLVLSLSAAAAAVEVQVDRFFVPGDPSNATTRRLIDLMKENQDLDIVEWTSLSLPGASSRAPLMMSIAGRTAPDILGSWFHIIRTDVDQGFLHPLNEWIGDDDNGNGRIDDTEVRWEPWKQVPPLLRQVATTDGRIYGLPNANRVYVGVVFRKDLVRAAGLDPNHPPETWEEFYDWSFALTDPHKEVAGAVIARGQRAIVLLYHGFMWLPWMQTTGGDPIIQIRTSPTTGAEHVFPMQETAFVTAEGEDLASAAPTWRCNFASPDGIRAARLFHDLMWRKWMLHPVTGEPITLTSDEITRGYVDLQGRRIAIKPEEVITGVARAETAQLGTGIWELLGRGEVAMATWFVQDLNSVGASAGIDPDLLGWFPFPAAPGPKGRRVVQFQQHYVVMSEGVGRRPKAERDEVWKVLQAVTDQKTADGLVRQRVLIGLANFVNPQDLQRLGFDDYLRDVPQSIRRNYAEIEDGTVATFTEPFMGFWGSTNNKLGRAVISQIIADSGENFDYESALKQVERAANSGLMFAHSDEELARWRPWARGLFVLVIGAMAGLVVLLVRSWTGGDRRESRAGSLQLTPWLIAAPALILIGLWSYYPLLKGMVMAFQDYKVVGDRPFIGLDNFISLALDQSFWISLWRTVEFVFLNVALGFTAPILLALLLSEVPRGKVFFRTLFFLLQLFAWLPLVDFESQTWLLDPKLAMICCVIPTVWASMGMASLIYLAALKGVPDELYEAAEVDGAGIWTKLRRITLPTLLPLIIINFVGVFIATFQNMGNIFLMTFGGPGDATMVLALRIWIEAYNNLRFSMATTMAWVLGSLLIGFTYVQIQFLKRVEFRKANWD